MDLFDDVCVWDALRSAGQPVVLYGMGDGADKVISALEKSGIGFDGVMASDSFVRGQSFHGFKVKRLADFEEELDRFTIALCFATQLPEVISAIKSAAARHRLLVPTVPVFGEVLFDRDFIDRYNNEIAAARKLFADDFSRLVYDTVLRFYHCGDISLLDGITTAKDEAFREILRLGGGEVYVDLGAYDGDTIDEFLSCCGGEYNKIVALEPNAKNFAKLKAHCEGMERTELLQLGAWSCDAELTFNNKAGRCSAVSDKGVKTRVIALDGLKSAADATYIKADVEGADAEALNGMKNILRAQKPKLNFSAYHRFEDLFLLPLLINSLNPEYKIYLRHHPYIPAWDTNIYCI